VVAKVRRLGVVVRPRPARVVVHMKGAQLTGWVEHSRLTKISGAVGFTGGGGRAAPSDREIRAVIVTGPGIFHGLAHIDAGTPVFALRAGGEPWATVRDGEAEFEVVVEPGKDRAQVWRALFIPHLSKAWVSLTAVRTLPTKPGP
jgi:hypothetical protein